MEGLEHLPDRYKVPLSKFKERLVKELEERIEAVVLYGSVAKGEAHDASDIDIMVIAKDVEHLREAISRIRYDIDLEHGTLTTLVYLTPGEIEDRVRKGSAFITKVLKEGVALYGRENLKRYISQAIRTGREVPEHL